MILKNQLRKIVVDEIKLWAANFNDLYGILPGVRSSFNSGEQQSVSPDLTCFIYEMDVQNVGFQGEKYSSDGLGGIDAQSRQLVQQPYQVKFLDEPKAVYAPTDTSLPTSLDAAQMLAMWLQSSPAISRFQDNCIGLYRITGVKNHKPKNSSDMYEPEPTFDFILSYTQTSEAKANKLDSITGTVKTLTV